MVTGSFVTALAFALFLERFLERFYCIKPYKAVLCFVFAFLLLSKNGKLNRTI